MTLGELIAQYRKEHKLSQRQMGGQCGVSTGYISLIEKEINPQTGKPMVPTLTVLNKIAKGMGITIDELIAACDDMPVDMNKKSIIPESSGGFTRSELQLISLYRELNAEGQEKLVDHADDLVASGKYIKTDAS